MIQTEHLELYPHSPDQLLALIHTPDQYQRLSGFPAAAGLREFFVSGDVSADFLASLHALDGPDPWHLGFAVVHPASSTVIGSGGFKGPPTPDGMVEIAYGIVPEHQGRGYATEVASALVGYARQFNSVKLLRAHTLPTPNASTRVLTKCGFGFVGEVVDPDDGLVWRWHLQAE